MDSSWMDSAEKHGIVSAHQAKATKQVRDPRGSLKLPTRNNRETIWNKAVALSLLAKLIRVKNAVCVYERCCRHFRAIWPLRWYSSFRLIREEAKSWPDFRELASADGTLKHRLLQESSLCDADATSLGRAPNGQNCKNLESAALGTSRLLLSASGVTRTLL